MFWGKLWKEENRKRNSVRKFNEKKKNSDEAIDFLSKRFQNNSIFTCKTCRAYFTLN